MIATKDRKHTKIVSDLCQDVTDEQLKSAAQLDAATEQYRSLKRDYNAVLDDIINMHRTSLRKQQIEHAQ